MSTKRMEIGRVAQDEIPNKSISVELILPIGKTNDNALNTHISQKVQDNLFGINLYK